MFDLISKSIGSLVMLFAQLMISNAENLNVRVNSNIRSKKIAFHLSSVALLAKGEIFVVV